MRRVKLFNLSWLFALGLGLSIISSIFNLVIPLQIRKTIDLKQLIRNKIGLKLVLVIILLLIISALVRTMSDYIISREGDKQIARIRLQAEEHLLHLPLNYFDDHVSGELASHIINDSYVIKNFVAQVIPSLITNVLTIIGTFGILFFLDWRITCLILLSFPILFLISLPIGKVTERISIDTQTQLSELTGTTTEGLQKIRTVKLSTAEPNILQKFRNNVNRIYRLSIKADMINAIIDPIQSVMTFGIIIGIIVYGGMRVSSGALTIGTLVSMLLYFFQVMPAMDSLANFYTQYKQATGATQQLTKIINLPVEENQGELIVPEPDKMDTIKFQNMTFSYNRNLVLKNISMEFPNRKKIAIVGPSGGGKTTIINLLTRLYSLDSGDLLLGSKSANEFELKSWRNIFSVVTQENSIVVGTIRDNLQFGIDDKFSDDDLISALKQANLWDEIKKLPLKLDTVVGDQGVKLSGGQRQRIQIARAYLRSSPLLIFDEATSNLDADSEALVSQSINQMTSKRTVIVIAHRLSTIIDSDCIYFLDNHKIQASGTHKDLLKQLPAYEKFVNEQMLSK